MQNELVEKQHREGCEVANEDLTNKKVIIYILRVRSSCPLAKKTSLCYVHYFF